MKVEQIAMPTQRVLQLAKFVVLSSLVWLLTGQPATSETSNVESNATALSFVKNNSQEFSPIRGETYRFSVNVPEPAKSISLAIYTSDGDLLRTITQPGNDNAGLHALTWDGKDDDGKIVPDEAYVPVVTVEFENGDKQTIDPRSYSGGELIDKVPVEITPDKAISYHLPAASRVLIRAGIKGGPMLRNLTSWQPNSAGKNSLRWDGKDQSGLFDVRNEQNLGILLIAFKLPEHSVLTYGNQALDYRAYRAAKQWQEKVIAPEKMQLNRNGAAVSQHYYAPRAFDVVPAVALTLPSELPKSRAGLPKIKLNTPVQVKTDIAEQDRWMMKQSLYEVAFFVDHEFVAEEEQGYVPLTWQWSPQQLKPGKHLLTVNISGFSGKVGVASLFFEVSK